MTKPETNLVVYTAVFGGYDTLRDPLTVQADVRYVCFTDRPQLNVNVWEIVIDEKLATSNARAARYRKIRPDIFLPDIHYSLWVDANILFRGGNLLRLIQTYLSKCDLALFAHAERICVYREADAVLALRKEFPPNVHRQMQAYRNDGYPKNNGLCETGVMLRKHTTALYEFNEFWWRELVKWTHRDQLSFNYACWKTGMQYETMPGGARGNRCPWLTYSPHG